MTVIPDIRDQQFLLPPSLGEKIPLTHPVRFVAEFVDCLPPEMWDALGMDLAGNPRGRPSLSMQALLGIWLYGFLCRVRSTRKLEAACREQLPFMWIGGLAEPDHNTLWLFYTRHRTAMRQLLHETVQVALAAGLVDLAIQAVDGTKIVGNASLKRSRTARGLRELAEKTDRAIAELEAQNEAGEGGPPALPTVLDTKQALRKRVQTAMRELARRTGGDPAVAPRAPATPAAPAPEVATTSAAPRKPPRVPDPQVNLTDLDARVLKGPHGGYIVGYNAETVVSPLKAAVTKKKRSLIPATSVVTDEGDRQQLVPMVEAAEAETGARPLTLADGGFHSAANLAAMAERGQAIYMPDPQAAKPGQRYVKEHFVYDAASDTYRCPAGQLLRRLASPVERPGGRVPAVRYQAENRVCGACLVRAFCQPDPTPKAGAAPAERRKPRRGRSITVTADEERLRTHRELMRQEPVRATYRGRQELIEPKFGTLKEQRDGRRMLLRGVENVGDEWTLLAAADNLRTLWAVWVEQPADQRFSLRRAAA